MKWIRLHTESTEQTHVIPIELTNRQIKVIQNYMTKQKSLNDPSNKECLDIVLHMLQTIIKESDIETLDIKVSNFLFEKYGIEIELDPYGKNTGIELTGYGLIELRDCNNQVLSASGKYAKYVENGLWKKTKDGNLIHGFISIDNLNYVLKNEPYDNEIGLIQLKKDGNIARIAMDL